MSQELYNVYLMSPALCSVGVALLAMQSFVSMRPSVTSNHLIAVSHQVEDGVFEIAAIHRLPGILMFGWWLSSFYGLVFVNNFCLRIKGDIFSSYKQHCNGITCTCTYTMLSVV